MCCRGYSVNYSQRSETNAPLWEPHREPRSMDDAPDTLGICRLVVADSFKAEGGTLPRGRGTWRPADGTLRQMLFPRRT